MAWRTYSAPCKKKIRTADPLRGNTPYRGLGVPPPRVQKNGKCRDGWKNAGLRARVWNRRRRNSVLWKGSTVGDRQSAVLRHGKRIKKRYHFDPISRETREKAKLKRTLGKRGGESKHRNGIWKNREGDNLRSIRTGRLQFKRTDPSNEDKRERALARTPHSRTALKSAEIGQT